MKSNMFNTVFPNANKNNGIVFSEEKLNSNSKLKSAVWQEVKQAQYKFLIFYYTKKVMDEYEKSEFAVDYTQSELACIKEFFVEKFGR
jgi:hypothetical protein